MGFHRRTYAEVDLAKLDRNFKALRGILRVGAFICPMVKANAYGHGDIEVATSLEHAGATRLGVALVEEGIRLRTAGIKTSLLVFGIFEDDSVDAILENRLTPVVSHWDQLKLLADRVRQHGRVPLHIKFNTGMNRLGFNVDEAPKLRSWLDAHPQFSLEGVATHLLRGEDVGQASGDTEKQLHAFSRALAAFQGLSFQAHALNSSAAVNLFANQRPLDFGMRPGIALYGITPATQEALSLRLEPCLSFRSHIAMTHRLNPGESISYNAIWTAKRPSRLGVVPLGYGDGFPRVFSNNAEVLCRGRRAPVVGQVCMDYFMVDLTDVESATGAVEKGEEVVMIGESQGAVIGADELARWASTISYEILTRISERVPRRYMRSETRNE